MKSVLLLLLIVPFAKSSYYKNVNGYIVTLADDTVSVQIKLPGFMGYNLNKEVQVIDSSGEAKILLPSEIKAFGYTQKSANYIYRSKPVDNGKKYFLEPVIVGPRASLYQYTRTSGGENMSTHEFYTFEKPDGTYMFMTNYAALTTFREKLKAFYGGSAEIDQLINSKFEFRRHIQRDIRAILEAVNKL
ncbi:MAG TPA: hypothetical protein VD996_00940 [Chitinophagaceae bacterium]|nr:hypothetical protein [Chitinophagaceae bacterium]